MKIIPLLCAATATVTMPLVAWANGKDDAEIRKVSSKYAVCVVRKHHDKASEVILSIANNSAIIRSQIVDADCLTAVAGNVEMRFPNDTYKYALADALVAADYTDHGVADFADRLPLAQPVVASPEQEAEELGKIKNGRKRKQAQEDMAKRDALAWLSRYGECIVRKDPVNARYWLLTPTDTPEETSRIRALQPAFSDCLSGGTMHFNRVTLRGTVAVNYYRLAQATVVPTAGSAH